MSVRDELQHGLDHHRAGRLAEAEQAYQRVLEADPDNADALQFLGATAHQAGKHETAFELMSRALHLHPSNPYLLNNLGEVSRALHRPGAALTFYDKALEVKPDLAMTLSNRGIALFDLQRFAEALASYDRALAIKPDYAEALSNRGIVLRELKRYDEAIACYDAAIKLRPGYAEALSNRGNALKQAGRYAEALDSYDKALRIHPDDISARWNRSLILLLTGDFERGWKEFEWRWQWSAFPSMKRNFTQPLWLGDADIAGKTILLHAEQGLGDCIQFVRYVHSVARDGAKVVLEVEPALKRLLSGIPGAQQVLGAGEPLPAFDFHCPLLSLPLAFNTTVATIPADIPYLSVDATAVAAWRTKLAVKDKPLVGLCWKGSPRNAGDRERSMRLGDLLPLLACEGVQFVGLQKALDEEERGIAAGQRNFTHPGADFRDTAAIVGALDLVISVDTAWAHWAGAIGKPLWILLPFSPDWRWLAGRDDTPWYPDARLWRQGPGRDWRSVVERVAREIRLNPP